MHSGWHTSGRLSPPPGKVSRGAPSPHAHLATPRASSRTRGVVLYSVPMPVIQTTLEPWRDITVTDAEYAALMRQGLVYLGTPVPPPPTEAERAYALISAQVAAVVQAMIAASGTGGSGSGSGSGSDPLASFRAKLSTDPASVKIALVGDSTRDVAANGVNYHNAIKSQIAPGRPLEGMTDSNILNHAFNGATVQVITNSTNMAALTTAAPDLVEFSMGINNMRVPDPATGVTMTVDRMEEILVAGVEAIRAAVPGVPLVGSIPNPFLTTADAVDPKVTPNADAQLKSGRLRAAYLRLVGRWPKVTIRDTAPVFGTVSLASSPLMADQIHPNALGAQRSAAGFTDLIGRLTPPSLSQILAARAASPYVPWTVYGREVEDTDRYVLVAEARYLNQGSNYLDFELPSQLRNNIVRTDIIEMPDGTAFQLPQTGGGVAISANGASTRIGVTTVPANTAVAGRGVVRVWRRRFGGDSIVENMMKDTSWRYKKIGVVNGGSTTYLDIAAASNTAERTREVASDWTAQVQAGDLVYVEGAGATPATVTAGQFSANGTNLRLSSGLAGVDYSAYQSRLAVIVGAHA